MLRSQRRVYDGSGEVARTQDVWSAEGISGRVKFLPLAWAGMPKTSFRKNSDSPILPNIFEAYLFDYHIDDEFYLGSDFVRTAKGWENNGNAADFVDKGEAFGGTGELSWLAWGKYQQAYIDANIWYYYIKDVQQIFFMDATYQNRFNDISMN